MRRVLRSSLYRGASAARAQSALRQVEPGEVIASKPGCESGLQSRPREPARLAAAVAEVAVVEGERGEARLGEALRVERQALVVDAGGAGAEHDAGCVVAAGRRGSEEPGGALRAARIEAQLLRLHRLRLASGGGCIQSPPWPTWRRSRG